MALADYIRRKPVIDTMRLRIRPLQESDVPALNEWMANKSIYAFLGRGPGKTDKNPELLFGKPEKSGKGFTLGIEEKESGNVIGDIRIHRIENDRMAAVMVRLAPSSQEKGYGTEALAAVTRYCFENTELQRLWAEADVRNIPALQMLEKCGYRREGLIRQGKMGNAWCDYCIYAVLSSDFSEAAARVERMETLFDAVSAAVRQNSALSETDDALRDAVRDLSDYQESGDWARDYRLDEAGMLPAGLKRGVLSQDGLYDLLCEPVIKALLSGKS